MILQKNKGTFIRKCSKKTAVRNRTAVLLNQLLIVPEGRSVNLPGERQRSCRQDYAFPTEPKISIFSLTFALIASVPGASSLRGSKPLPCLSLPASI